MELFDVTTVSLILNLAPGVGRDGKTLLGVGTAILIAKGLLSHHYYPPAITLNHSKSL